MDRSGKEISFPDLFFFQFDRMGKRDFIIVGLGNPGEKYRSSRHNAGFLVVEELAKSWGASFFQEKWQAYCSSLFVGKRKVHLIKPLTFMNRSGQAVCRFYSFLKICPDQLLVIHDDLDMPPARVKLVKGGGTGGHNGIKSLVESLGERDFFRLKVGIGRPGSGDIHRDFPVDKYVLSDFTAEERQNLTDRYKGLIDGIEFLLQDDQSRAMTLLNQMK
ncbi:MAG: aminoacyl-tRNA hydrolase [Desulforhopalus sp.]